MTGVCNKNTLFMYDEGSRSKNNWEDSKKKQGITSSTNNKSANGDDMQSKLQTLVGDPLHLVIIE